MWTGAKAALDEQLTNVRFLRTHIDHITDFFAPKEVSEIWITFADPQPHKPRKRLSSYKFLNIYRKIASEHTLVNVKTDSDLFLKAHSRKAQQDQLIVLSQIDNVYQLNQVPEFLKIQTYYEKMWLKMGRSIKYCQFILGNCESVPLKEDC